MNGQEDSSDGVVVQRTSARQRKPSAQQQLSEDNARERQAKYQKRKMKEQRRVTKLAVEKEKGSDAAQPQPSEQDPQEKVVPKRKVQQTQTKSTKVAAAEKASGKRDQRRANSQNKPRKETKKIALGKTAGKQDGDERRATSRKQQSRKTQEEQQKDDAKVAADEKEMGGDDTMRTNSGRKRKLSAQQRLSDDNERERKAKAQKRKMQEQRTESRRSETAIPVEPSRSTARQTRNSIVEGQSPGGGQVTTLKAARERIAELEKKVVHTNRCESLLLDKMNKVEELQALVRQLKNSHKTREQELQGRNNVLFVENQGLKKSVQTLTKEKATLVSDNDKLKAKVEELKTENKKLKPKKKYCYRKGPPHHEVVFEENLAKLKAFKETHGHCNPEFNSGNPEERKLALWATRVRSHHRKYREGKGTMPVDRIQRLMEVGFDFKLGVTTYLTWEERFEQLKAYHARYQTTHVSPTACKNDAPDGLGHFVQVQRKKWKSMQLTGKPCKTLTKERIALLDSIGFQWQLRQRGPSTKKQKGEETETNGNPLNDEAARIDEYGDGDDTPLPAAFEFAGQYS